MAYTTYHKAPSGRIIRTHFQDYKKYKAFRNKKSGQLVDKAKYQAFQKDTEAKKAANVKAGERQAVLQSRLGHTDKPSGREAQETAMNIANAARSGANVGRESSISQGQADAAKAQLTTLRNESSAAKTHLTDKYAAENAISAAKNKEEYAKGIAAAKKAGMTVKGLPVKLNPSTGKLQYDLQKIGASMGLSPDAVKKAVSVNFGKRQTTTEGRIQDMVGGGMSKSQGAVSDAWSKQAGKLSDTGAIMNNLAILDPLKAKVDVTKQDHMINLTKAGFMHDSKRIDPNKRLNMNQGSSGIGKYASAVLPKVVGGMLALATGGAGTPLAAAIAGAGTQAAYGGLTAKAMGQDPLKGALMGAGTSAVGTAAGALSGAAGEAIGGGTVGNLTKNAVSGLTTGFGGEALSALVEGEKFNVGDALTSSAVGTAGGVAGDYAASLFQEGGALDGYAGGANTGVAAPTALEVGMSPGDYGNLNTISNQDRYFASLRDIGYGPGAGLEEGKYGNYDVASGTYRDTHSQDQTIEQLGGPYAQGADTTFSAGPLEAPFSSLPNAPQDLTGHITGLATTGLTKELDAALNPDTMSIEELGGPYIEGEQTEYREDPIGSPFEEVIKPEKLTPEEELARIATGQGLIGESGNYEQIPGIQDPLIAAGINPARPVLDNYVLDQKEGLQGGEQTAQLSDLAGLLGTIPGGIMAGGLGSGGGTTTGRQGQVVGIQDSTAGAEDPLSEQQVLKTGMHAVNPALLSQYMEYSNLSDEERKKRQMMWMNNPSIEG